MPDIDYGAIGASAGNALGNVDISGNTGSGSGFDIGGFFNNLVSSVPGILGGVAQVYDATHPANQNTNGITYNVPYGNNNPPAPANNNTALYVGIGVAFLLLLLLGMFFIARK